MKYMLPGTWSPGLMSVWRDEVLRAAALVGGHDVAVAVVALDRRLQVVEVAAPGVRLVAEHHPGPLAVAHRGRAGVREQVDVDVVRAEQEGVVARLAQGALARSSRAIIRSGSTILIFHGSAQERRPSCWPIVWSCSCGHRVPPVGIGGEGSTGAMGRAVVRLTSRMTRLVWIRATPGMGPGGRRGSAPGRGGRGARRAAGSRARRSRGGTRAPPVPAAITAGTGDVVGAVQLAGRRGRSRRGRSRPARGPRWRRSRG